MELLELSEKEMKKVEGGLHQDPPFSGQAALDDALDLVKPHHQKPDSGSHPSEATLNNIGKNH